MMKFPEAVRTVVVMSAMLAALTACQKDPGPAERAGKEVDKATAQVGQQIEKAGQEIQDAAKSNKK